MTYTPITERTKRSRDRVVIDGVDVTYFRNAGATDITYELTDPYGYGPGSIAFPDVSLLEEHLFGEPGELSWLRDGARVRIDRVLDGAVVKRGIYRGHIFTKRPRNDGTVLELAGEASGRLSMRYRPQELVRKTRDVGLFVAQAFHDAGLRFTPFRGPTTGVEIDNGTGGVYNLGWVDECLALSYDGQPWTAMPTAGGKGVYEMRRKDLTTVHCTVWADAFGVDVDVVDDLTEKPNAAYGAGVSPDGAMWLNSIWPDLGPEQVPPFPGVMKLGDTGESVTVLKIELVSDGKLTGDDLGGGYNAGVVEAIETIQESAGLPVTGEVDAATWAQVWGDSVTNQHVGSGQVMPLVIRDEVRKFNHTANGSVSGRNPKHDRSVIRRDRFVAFPAGTRKQVARKWFRQELRRLETGANYYGTITLDADVWVGDHTHDTAGTVLEKELIEGGWNIKVKKPGRDLLFHIASAYRRGNQVVLTVDTKGRDYLNVGEMIERDEEARRDVARSGRRRHQNSRQTHDAMTGWFAEDGAGLIRRKVKCPGNQWTVFWVIGGQEGDVMRTILKTSNSPAAFVMAVAGEKFAAEALTRRVPDPWALDEDNEPAWNNPNIQDWLHDEKRFCYVIGDANNPGGYWPKKHTNAAGNVTSHPITGEHRDWMTWPYTTGKAPILWVAIHPDRDTVIEPQELFRASRNLGG